MIGAQAGSRALEKVSSNKHSKLIAEIAGQLAESTDKEREDACRQVREECQLEHSLKRKQMEEDIQQVVIPTPLPHTPTHAGMKLWCHQHCA